MYLHSALDPFLTMTSAAPFSLTHALTFSTLTLTHPFRWCLATVPHAAREKEPADVDLPPFPCNAHGHHYAGRGPPRERVCADPLVVTEDPQLIGIRAVYVPLFSSLIRILKRPS